ncbi:hypothetical protein L6172_00765 [Thalassospiraceae bacterium SW-3-3]|nr:hypothetical protein L6172_00765 [Thalassospiraceae bacterium SW-3-3]
MFRKKAGFANFRLNTIMVGLEGVRRGTISKPDDLAVYWKPTNFESAAMLAKAFASDSAMVFIVDAIDTYIRNISDSAALVSDITLRSVLAGEFQLDTTGCRQPSPSDLEEFTKNIQTNSSKIEEIDKIIREFSHHHFGRKKRPSLVKRFDELVRTCGGLPNEYQSAIHLLISWRNRHVHGNAKDTISTSDRNKLSNNADFYMKEHSNLDVSRMLDNYLSHKSPTLKELSSLISMTHRSIRHIDEVILSRANIEEYAKEFWKSNDEKNKLKIKKCLKNWSKGKEYRLKKLSSTLKENGFSTSRGEKNAILLSGNLIESLSTMEKDKAILFFENSAPE